MIDSMLPKNMRCLLEQILARHGKKRPGWISCGRLYHMRGHRGLRRCRWRDCKQKTVFDRRMAARNRLHISTLVRNNSIIGSRTSARCVLSPIAQNRAGVAILPAATDIYPAGAPWNPIPSR